MKEAFLYLSLIPIITLSLILSHSPLLLFSLTLLSPAGHNAAPLLDLKCSIVGTISPSPQWGPLGLTISIVGCVMVQLHARPISLSMYILFASVFSECVIVVPG